MTAVHPALMPDCRRDRPRAKSIAARWFGLQIGTARPWLLSPCILMLSSRSRQSAASCRRPGSRSDSTHGSCEIVLSGLTRERRGGETGAVSEQFVPQIRPMGG